MGNQKRKTKAKSKAVKKTKKGKTAKKEIAKAAKTLDKKLPSKLNESETNLRNLVAEVLNISPFGVDVIKGVPYINKLGRKQKLEEYGKGKEKVIYRWVKLATDDLEKAVCEAKIVRVGKTDDIEKNVVLTPGVIGECSDKTMGMSTLKGYQNHIAQTRAHNRVIEERYGLRIHEDMLKELAKLEKKGEKLPEINTNVSAEEIISEKEFSSAEDMSENDMFEKAKSMIPGITNITALEKLKRDINLSKIYTDAHKHQLVKLIEAQLKIV